MAKVVIVDDDAGIRATLTRILEDDGHVVLQACDGHEGVRLCRDELPDIVLLDIKMPGRDGLSALEEIKASVDCEAIMISGHGTIEAAVQAIKQGAYHFLQKPPSLVEVRQTVRHAGEAKSQRDELRLWRRQEREKHRIVGAGTAIQALGREIEKIAPTTGRVLITGPSGTGKELVAWAVHHRSDRAAKPFVKINCAAIPRELIESELFGHEKGSFTGAVALKKGKFEAADGGTLFLDEIGDMDLNTQTKVLRAIQEGEFERVGGSRTIRVDVRIIAATHRNLEEMIRAGSFREDLYYRICVVPLRVPPLCERREDIPDLAAHFLDAYCRDNGMPPRRFSSDALRFLIGQDYPGNIRQLRNIVERAAIMSSQAQITAEFLQSLLGPGKSVAHQELFSTPRPLHRAQQELEKAYILTQLRLNEWNIPRTAEVLGIQRTNLHRKIRVLGIERAETVR